MMYAYTSLTIVIPFFLYYGIFQDMYSCLTFQQKMMMMMMIKSNCEKKVFHFLIGFNFRGFTRGAYSEINKNESRFLVKEIKKMDRERREPINF